MADGEARPCIWAHPINDATLQIRFAEVPVHHYHRVYGASQFWNWRRLVRVVGERHIPSIDRYPGPAIAVSVNRPSRSVSVGLSYSCSP